MGHHGLQLRHERGAELPDLERPVLAGAVPHRRPAGGRGGVHAVSGLQPPRRRVGAEHPRRQGKPGGHRLPAQAEHRRPDPPPRKIHDRGGVHRLAQRHQTGGGRRPRLQLQVEHGLDERYAQLYVQRPHLPLLQPQQGHLQFLLRFQREFRPAHQPRRGGARQVQPHQQDAGRV